MCKDQGRERQLNAQDHRALRRYCLWNRHATMMDMATSVQRTLENPCHSTQSAAASRTEPWNCIMQSGRHLFILCRNAAEFSGPKGHPRWTERRKCVLWSDESTFQLVLVKNGCRILQAKDEKDHPGCYQQIVKKTASVMVWGSISAHGMADLHIQVLVI